MEPQPARLDSSAFPLADAQFLSTPEEMAEAARTPQSIIVKAQKRKRSWYSIRYGAQMISIAWLVIIAIYVFLDNWAEGQVIRQDGFVMVILVVFNLLMTGYCGYVFIWVFGLLPSRTMLIVDTNGLTLTTFEGATSRLRWQDIDMWAIIDQDDDSIFPNYTAYMFIPKEEVASMLEYTWYVPLGAYLPDKEIVEDRQVALQQRLRLARALISHHLGQPRGYLEMV